MEIKPHEDKTKVNLLIENQRDDIVAEEGYPDLVGHAFIDGEHLSFEQRQDRYPFTVDVKRRTMGHIASKAMVSTSVENIAIARQILEYFEAEAGIEKPEQKSEFPLYKMIIGGDEHWLRLRQAGIAYDSGFVQVAIGGLVLEEAGKPRPITPAERSEIADIADDWSAEK